MAHGETNTQYKQKNNTKQYIRCWWVTSTITWLSEENAGIPSEFWMKKGGEREKKTIKKSGFISLYDVFEYMYQLMLFFYFWLSSVDWDSVLVLHRVVLRPRHRGIGTPTQRTHTRVHTSAYNLRCSSTGAYTRVKQFSCQQCMAQHAREPIFWQPIKLVIILYFCLHFHRTCQPSHVWATYYVVYYIM